MLFGDIIVRYTDFFLRQSGNSTVHVRLLRPTHQGIDGCRSEAGGRKSVYIYLDIGISEFYILFMIGLASEINNLPICPERC